VSKERQHEENQLLRADLLEAELFLVRRDQLENFPEEVESLRSGGKINQKSPLSRLRPEWDKQLEVLVSVGRETRTPLIVLAKKSSLTRLLVLKAHERVFHAGVQATLGKITRLLSDSNGFARAAEILNQGKLFVRSTRHLYPLEGATSVEEVPDEPEDERAQEDQPKEAQRKVTVTRYGRTVRPVVH
jgi:hypothetical protein